MQKTTLCLGDRLREGEILIIVPPFAGLGRPSLAAHVLQACAGAAGFRVSVLYANLLLAKEIGADAYNAIIDAPPQAMLGERMFSRSAYGMRPFGQRGSADLDLPELLADRYVRDSLPEFYRLARSAADPDISPASRLGLTLEGAIRIERQATSFVEEVARMVAALPFKVVGSTTTFDQTNSSIALLTRIKDARPDVITILGGANCEGEMAEGIAALDARIDHVFSGEAEVVFPDFLRRLAAGEPVAERILEGSPCMDLGALPTPDFTEYFEQRAHLTADGILAIEPATIPYESSRGCWWGQKHHCTFCGLNGEGMVFREKTADRVIEELRALAKAHEARAFCVTDNIMPHAYWKTLLPRLTADPLPLPLFYEQKSNLSLEQVIALKRAGITSIQPGIEALSSALLKRMDKGVLARQNLALLRYGRAVGLDMQWNLLWKFPGDEPEAYDETLALLPLLRHLQPPSGLIPISLDRFSPYFQRPEAYGVKNLRPHPTIAVAFPDHADIPRVAYRFVGDYPSGAYDRADAIGAIRRDLEAWQASWARPSGPPVLRINALGTSFLLRDTRGIPGTEEALILEEGEAMAMLRAGPYTPSRETDLAVARRLGVVVDGHYIPLVTASPSLLLEVERQARTERAAAGRGRRALPIAAGASSERP